MQYGDADVTVLLDVGVPDICNELELRRPERILLREDEVTFEEPALIKGIRRADNQNLISETESHDIFY